MSDVANITADAVALQERDEFRAQGWLKLIAPAKVNLHLAIGPLRPDGYHEVATVLHALSLHDVVYLRRKLPNDADPSMPTTRLVSCGDVEAPDVSSQGNIATKAVAMLAQRLGRDDVGIEVRIEKNIPAQGGLGGGSSDAAAALVGAAHLWGVAPNDALIEETARRLGSDVAFFLHGGCAYFEGAGDEFIRFLEPSKRSIALVRPDAGVSTAESYRTFDESPVAIPPEIAMRLSKAVSADEVEPFNNLAPASEKILPQLGEIRAWLSGFACVADALLCGSGSTTFAICDDFSSACHVVAEARKRGLWARATSLSSIRSMALPT